MTTATEARNVAADAVPARNPGMDAMHVEQFLDAAFGEKPDDSWLLLWTLPDRASRWHQDIGPAVAEAVTLDDHDLYVGVALSAKKRRRNERGKVGDAAGIVGLWADIDIADDVAHKKPNLPPDEDAARRVVESCGLEPTVLVHSGHGLQAWWLFPEPWMFDEPRERDQAQDLSRQWNATLRMHAAQDGWVIDSTHDLTRVLRLPGSVNHKTGIPVRVRLLGLNGTRYQPSEFEPYLAAPEMHPARVGSIALAPSVRVDDLDLRPLTDGRLAKITELAARLCEADAKFDKTWNHKRTDLPSLNEYDLAIAKQLAGSCSPQQIRDLIELHRVRFPKPGEEEGSIRKARRRDYIETTFATAGVVAIDAAALAVDNNGDDCADDEAPVDDDRQPRRKGRRRIEPTELGTARRLVAQHGDDLMHVADAGRWHAWDGRRWALDVTGEVQRRTKTVVDGLLDEMPGETEEGRKALVRHYFAAQKASVQNGIIALAKTELAVVATVDQLDTDPWLLNVANGTLDLRTGKVRPHRREDRITKLAPVKYEPDATCPRWEAFMRWACCGDRALVGYLQRLVGYSLAGDVSEQSLPFLNGDGENGKSTFLGICEDLLGLGDDGYALHAAKTLLVAARHQEHPTVIADLVGRRLVICTEVDEGDHFDEVLVKQLTGGDTVKGRFMRQDYFSFKPTGKFWLSGNHRPRVRGTDHAIWRRIKLIPFEAIIPAGKRDGHLPEKLRAELPGIFAWAVRGCLAWQKDGLQEPKVVSDATTAYRGDQDTVGRFLGACCEVGENYTVKSTELHDAYGAWCKENGIEAVSQKALAPRLEARGYEKVQHPRTRQAQWKGIGLTASDQGECEVRSLAKGSAV